MLLVSLSLTTAGCNRLSESCQLAYEDESSMERCVEECLDTAGEATCERAIDAVRATVRADPEPALLIVGCRMGATDLCEQHAAFVAANAVPEPAPPQRTTMVPPTDQAAIDQNIAAVAADLRAQAPLPTAADNEGVSRSTEAGTPGVANSCNLIRTLRECYEHAPSLGTGGFYSTSGTCGGTGIFGPDACPMDGRVGTCVLGDGQQIAHFYNDHVGLGDQCTTQYGGRWVPIAEGRVLPVNAP